MPDNEYNPPSEDAIPVGLVVEAPPSFEEPSAFAEREFARTYRPGQGLLPYREDLVNKVPWDVAMQFPSMGAPPFPDTLVGQGTPEYERTKEDVLRQVEESRTPWLGQQFPAIAPFTRAVAELGFNRVPLGTEDISFALGQIGSFYETVGATVFGVHTAIQDTYDAAKKELQDEGKPEPSKTEIAIRTQEKFLQMQPKGVTTQEEIEKRAAMPMTKRLFERSPAQKELLEKYRQADIPWYTRLAMEILPIAGVPYVGFGSIRNVGAEELGMRVAAQIARETEEAAIGVTKAMPSFEVISGVSKAVPSATRNVAAITGFVSRTEPVVGQFAKELSALEQLSEQATKLITERGKIIDSRTLALEVEEAGVGLTLDARMTSLVEEFQTIINQSISGGNALMQLWRETLKNSSKAIPDITKAYSLLSQLERQAVAFQLKASPLIQLVKQAEEYVSFIKPMREGRALEQLGKQAAEHYNYLSQLATEIRDASAGMTTGIVGTAGKIYTPISKNIFVTPEKVRAVVMESKVVQAAQKYPILKAPLTLLNNWIPKLADNTLFYAGVYRWNMQKARDAVGAFLHGENYDKVLDIDTASGLVRASGKHYQVHLEFPEFDELLSPQALKLVQQTRQFVDDLGRVASDAGYPFIQSKLIPGQVYIPRAGTLAGETVRSGAGTKLLGIEKREETLFDIRKLTNEQVAKYYGTSANKQVSLALQSRAETVPNKMFGEQLATISKGTAPIVDMQNKLNAAKAMVTQLEAKTGSLDKVQKAALKNANKQVKDLGKQIKAQAIEDKSSQFVRMKGEIPEARGFLFEKETARKLEKELGTGRTWFDKTLMGVGKANDIMRTLMTSLDLATTQLQLLPMAVLNPVAWGKAWVEQLKALKSGEYFGNVLRKDNEFVNRMISYGASFPTFQEMVAGTRGLERIPVMGKLYEVFGRAYSTSISAAKYYHLKSMEATIMRNGGEQAMRQFVTHVENMTGSAQAAAQGIGARQHAIERAMLFAPMYLRSGIGLMTDIFRGGVVTKEAFKSMVTFNLAYHVGMSAVFDAMGGKYHADPRDPYYGYGEIGNEFVGVGGVVASMNRIIARVGRAAANNPESLITFNLDDWAKWVNNPIIKSIRTKESPVVGDLTSLIVGKTVIGTPTRRDLESFARFAGTSLVPISWQSFIDMYSRQTTGETLREVGINFLGINAWELPYYTRADNLLNQYIEQDKFRLESTHYDADKGLSKLGMKQLEEWHLDLKEARDKANKINSEKWATELERQFYEYRPLADASKAARNGELGVVENKLITNQTDVKSALKEYRDIQSRYYQNTQDLLKSYPDVKAYYDKPKTEQENLALFDKVLLDYERMFYNNPTLQNLDGTPNYAATNQAKEQFIKEYGQNLYDACIEYTTIDNGMPAFFKEYINGRDKFAWEYWGKDYGQERLEYRRDNPRVDAWLYTYGYNTTLITDHAREMVKGNQILLGIPFKEPPPAYDSLALRQELAGLETARDTAYNDAKMSTKYMSKISLSLMEQRKELDKYINRSNETLRSPTASPEMKVEALKTFQKYANELETFGKMVQAAQIRYPDDMWLSYIMSQLKVDGVQNKETKLQYALK